MEGWCGVFQSDLVGPWISGIGTVVAAATAWCIYRMNRRNQQRDIANRRRYLHAMLEQNLNPAIAVALETADAMKDLEMPAEYFARISRDMRPAQLDRLTELQEQLTSNSEPRDQHIASFIESLRLLDLQITAVRRARRRFEASDDGKEMDHFKDMKYQVQITRKLIEDVALRAETARDAMDPDHRWPHPIKGG
jgi:hypothetical protein